MRAATEIRATARAAADEAQRQAIAEATCLVIAAEGLEAASLRRIGSELGCTTGLITHYFASKEQLFIAALRWASSRLSELVVQQPAQRPDSLPSYLEFYYASLPSDQARRTYWLVLLAFRGATIGNPILEAVYREYSEETERSLCEALSLTTGYAQDDPELVRIAKGLSALLEGAGTSAAENPLLWTEKFVRSIVGPAAEGLLLSLEKSSQSDSSFRQNQK